MARKIGPDVHRPHPSLKYLKPGVLARLRDNRAGVAFARSHRCKADPFPPSLPEIEIPSAVNQAEGDRQSPPVVNAVSGGYGFVSIEERVCHGGEGPRCLTKKKVIAGRCVRLVRSEAQASPVAVVEETAAPSCKTDVCLD